MPKMPETTGLFEAFNPTAIPYAILWIACAIILMRLLRRLTGSLSERISKHRLVIKQVNTLSAFVVYLAAFVVSFNTLFTLSTELIFALSGTIAVTIGFAFKDVAASFLAGISILLNKPFQVGDRISFGGFYGEVQEIGLRTVRLVTLDDNLVTIPSNKFLTEPVASANAGQLDCMVVMNFYISPAADHERAKEIIEDSVLASKYLYLGKPFSVLVVNQISPQGQVYVELLAKAYVFDTRYEKSFASDVTDRVLKAFRANGIFLPPSIPSEGPTTGLKSDVPQAPANA